MEIGLGLFALVLACPATNMSTACIRASGVVGVAHWAVPTEVTIPMFFPIVWSESKRLS